MSPLDMRASARVGIGILPVFTSHVTIEGVVFREIADEFSLTEVHAIWQCQSTNSLIDEYMKSL